MCAMHALIDENVCYKVLPGEVEGRGRRRIRRRNRRRIGRWHLVVAERNEIIALLLRIVIGIDK